MESNGCLHVGHVQGAVRVLGNVVPASHGRTASETLGSGDAEATFSVSIGRSEGSELAFGVGRPDATSPVIVATVRPDGASHVVFGDGEHGEPVPSGERNVTAAYRSGIGIRGNVGAESLTTVLSGPLRVEAVTNPEPTSGGADAETLADAERSAPRWVRHRDRAVSVADFDDLVSTVPGVAVSRAEATSTWQPQDGGASAVLVRLYGTEITNIGITCVAVSVATVSDECIPFDVVVCTTTPGCDLRGQLAGVRSNAASPLRDLLDLLADEIDALQAQIEQLYDDLFVSTDCDWQVPSVAIYRASATDHTGRA